MDQDEFWKTIMAQDLAAEKDEMFGQWWPYHVIAKKHYKTVQRNGLNMMRTDYSYDDDYYPIPGSRLSCHSPISEWRRQTPSPSGVTSSSRMRRLEQTPVNLRDLLWAAEHVTGYKKIRDSWKKIARDLKVNEDRIRVIKKMEVNSDEKFYLVVKDWSQSGEKVYLDKLVEVLYRNEIFEVALYLSNPRFHFLYMENALLSKKRKVPSSFTRKLILRQTQLY